MTKTKTKTKKTKKKTCYIVTIPSDMRHISRFRYGLCDTKARVLAEVLHGYNDTRKFRAGLPPLKRLPAGTTIEIGSRPVPPWEPF